MKRYVIDTSCFAQGRDYYYPGIFEGFWECMDDAADRRIISSVDEVRAELQEYEGGQDHLLGWMERHAGIFTKPTRFEHEKIVEMVRRFGKKAIWKMNPRRMTDRSGRNKASADALIIAKAQVSKSAVVTCERGEFPIQKGQKNIKIPQICRDLGVECMDFHEFMSEMGWRFISAP